MIISLVRTCYSPRDSNSHLPMADSAMSGHVPVIISHVRICFILWGSSNQLAFNNVFYCTVVNHLSFKDMFQAMGHYWSPPMSGHSSLLDSKDLFPCPDMFQFIGKKGSSTMSGHVPVVIISRVKMKRSEPYFMSGHVPVYGVVVIFYHARPALSARTES